MPALVDEGAGRVAVDHPHFDAVGLGVGGHVGDDRLGRLPGALFEDGGIQEGGVETARRRHVPHVHGHDLVVLARVVERPAQGVAGVVGVVDADDDRFHAVILSDPVAGCQGRRSGSAVASGSYPRESASSKGTSGCGGATVPRAISSRSSREATSSASRPWRSTTRSASGRSEARASCSAAAAAS